MSLLQGKKILLGVTGSIAAYKTAFLCRLLIKSGCEVKIIMTSAAKDFITPLTLSTLSGHEVIDSVADGAHWNNHVELGLWADLMLIAPVTATTLGKLAHGIADNMVVASYLSAKCPVFLAPAMDLDMWKHPSTTNNINLLKGFGNNIIPVGHGFLASGLEGDGRMAEPEEIISYLSSYFSTTLDLLGKKVLITAGPTYEAIDPVRFIGNRSSGKMGLAIAKECVSRGAEVHMVLGPVSLSVDNTKIQVTKVQSAQQMYEAASKIFPSSDITILAAAVADYKAAEIADHKLKKTADNMSIQLEKTIDIAATFGTLKQTNQKMIGFALETNDEIQHATSKLHKKNLDFIVLNSLNDSGAGFQHDTNKITILDKQGQITKFDLKSKKEVASDIINYLVKTY